LALFVEAGCDRVTVFEADKQGRQGRLIKLTGFNVVPGLLETKPGEALNSPQALDPVGIAPRGEPAQQFAIAHLPIAAFMFQRFPDTLRQRLFDLRKLMLAATLFIVLVGIFRCRRTRDAELPLSGCS